MEYLNRNIKQCSLPLTMKNPENQTERVTLHPNSPTLYSGVTLTTLVNNLANLLIFTGINGLASSGVTSFRQAKDIVIRGANLAGYDVSCEVCTHPSQWQFLKHSFTDKFEPWLNIGVIFRTLGIASTEHYHRRRFDKHTFMCQLIRGFCHAGNSRITRMLRNKYPHGTAGVTGHYLVDNTTGNEYDVPDSAICSRYGCTVAEIDEFLQLYGSSGTGDVVRCSFTDKVMSIDYGY